MIITRTPFRVSFCGGGSDMADFYREHEGCVISTSINKYMYLMIHPYFDKKRTSLKYSQTELVDDTKDIKHRIFKYVLNEKKIHGVEITSTADVPSGTGLGSSSSFTVGLINALSCYQDKYISKGRLAQEACRVEIEGIGSPIGKQDQYAAAFGGLNFIAFHKDDTVSVDPVIASRDTILELQDNLVMFYTGITHDANAILSEQKKNVASREDKIQNLIRMCELSRYMKESLEMGELSCFGEILNEGWQRKRELASGVTSPRIDGLYETAIKNGALGGKLLGAGGGGFLLFYCPKENQVKLKEALGLEPFDFKFEHDGSSVIYVGDRYWEDR